MQRNRERKLIFQLIIFYIFGSLLINAADIVEKQNIEKK
jgi:hypothetical protein